MTATLTIPVALAIIAAGVVVMLGVLLYVLTVQQELLERIDADPDDDEASANRGQSMKNDHVWQCRIGGTLAVPRGADEPMRAAVEGAYFDLFGELPRGVFSSWGNCWERAEVPQKTGDNVWQCRLGGPAMPPDGAEYALRAAALQAFMVLTGRRARGAFTGWGFTWSDLEIDCLAPMMRDDSPCSAALQAQFEAHGLQFSVTTHDLNTNGPPRPGRPTMTMHPVLGTDGSYVGDAEVSGSNFRWLAANGIWNPLGMGEPDTASCIGLATAGDHAGKWFGWSHRARAAFGVGHVVQAGDCATSSGSTQEYLREHPEADRSVPAGFKCETLDDCRRVAEAFAESVG